MGLFLLYLLKIYNLLDSYRQGKYFIWHHSICQALLIRCFLTL